MNMKKNPDEIDKEPIEDGLSALRRLAALDRAKPQTSQKPASQEGDDIAESIPDWLELLLAKYGENAPMLVGIKSRPPGKPQAEFVLESPESSQVASLLDQMAAEVATQPPADRLATSVDWGGSARREDEEEETVPSQLDQPAEPRMPSPEIQAAEETPDWLTEITRSKTVVGGPPEPLPSVADEEARGRMGVPKPPVAATEQESVRTDAEVPEEEVPDWLKELSAAAAQPEEIAATPPVPESSAPPEAEETSEELTDWLARLTTPTAVGVEPQEAPSPTGAVGMDEQEEEVPDWLRDLESMQADQGMEGPGMIEEPPVESEVPDWLLELEAAEEMRMPGALTEATAESEEALPDWLQQLEVAGETAPAELKMTEPPSPPPSEVPIEVFEEPEEEVPDWLHRLEASARETRAEATEEFEPEVPEWLASLRREEPFSFEAAEEEVPPPEGQPVEPVQEPDWLAALRSTGEQGPVALEQGVVDAEEKEIPDWLAELRVSQAPVETPSAVAPAEVPGVIKPEPEAGPVEYPAGELEIEFLGSEQAELPVIEEREELAPEGTGALDWLTELEAEAAGELVEEVPVVEEEGAPAMEELPDWLRELPPVQIPESERETVETARLPEWMLLPSAEEGEVPAPVGKIEEPGEIEEALLPEETLAPAEVPDWLLKLKPGEEPAGVRREEPAEAEDVLAGIPGLLPVAEEELEREEEPIAALRSRIGVPQVTDLEGAKLFKEIAAERQPEPVQEAGKQVQTEVRRRRAVETLAWGFIFIVLIIAIALALMAVLNRVGNLLGGTEFREFFGSVRVIDPAPVNTFRSQVTRLAPGAVVIVSFEYSPATEAEMDPLAQVIVRDLLETQARVIGTSLRPQGAALAQRMFERFEEDYPYGQQTINLGYLPGQTMGVRNLAFLSSASLFQTEAATLQQNPAWQDVNTLQDVALIVVVADSPLPVRWWVEQMGPGTPGDRPLVAAVSAAADPSVRPYYNQLDPQSGQLLGLLSGVRDGAAYENRLGEPGRAVQSLAAQSVAHLGLVAISLGGTVVGFRLQATRDIE